MEKQAKEVSSGLRFINYVVNRIEFYNNEYYDEDQVKVDFHIAKEIEYMDDEDNTIFVTLDVKIFDNAKEKNYPFSMNISMTGIFEIDNIDKRTMFAEVNAIAILFPYLRAIVSTYTANANVTPLILPPINVVKLIQDQD